MNTWGISGPWFLVIYVGLVGLAGFAAFRERRPPAKPAPDHPVSPAELDPYELAVLNGGKRLAVTAAIANLRQADAIGPGSKAMRIQASGSLPANAHPIEQAVHDQIAQDGQQTLKTIQQKTIPKPAFTSLHGRLVQHGLLLGPEQTRRTQLKALWLVPVLLLGLVRLAAGVANQKPVALLDLALLATGIAVAVLWLRPARLSRQGHAALKELRHQHALLDPRGDLPRSYLIPNSPRMQLLAVALFGTGALWVSDRDWAVHLGLLLPLPRSAKGGSSGGCGGGCGGGGCGG
jgi:uncharacterized protein (TIGR04222 family)